MNVFFYGLFMDEQLLAAKGIAPSDMRMGYVDGFCLRIGARATLMRSKDDRAYGVLMDIAPDEAAALYDENSVTDYVAEPVTVELMEGGRIEAACYNLPVDKIAGANKDYARSLLTVAARLGFPENYLEQIRQAGA